MQVLSDTLFNNGKIEVRDIKFYGEKNHYLWQDEGKLIESGYAYLDKATDTLTL